MKEIERIRERLQNEDGKYPEYVQHACKKVEIYCDAGIYPGQNLILTYETKDNPLGMGQITRVLEEKFGM